MAMIPATAQPTNKKSNKFLVYCCVILVALVSSLVVFASVLNPRHPALTIDSLFIDSLDYDNSQPSFNINTHMIISLKNHNFGHFEFDHTNKNTTIMSVHYGHGSVVGSSELKYGTGRVASRGEEEAKKVNVVLSSSKSGLTVDDNNKLKSDLDYGLLELKGYATLKGKVHLLKFRFHTDARMNCDIAIHLTRMLVLRLVC